MIPPPSLVSPTAGASFLAGCGLSLAHRLLLAHACVLRLGEGAVYRAVSALQRAYFAPPDDRRASWGIELELERLRGSKLANRPPIEYAGDQRAVRYRKLRVVG